VCRAARFKHFASWLHRFSNSLRRGSPAPISLCYNASLAYDCKTRGLYEHFLLIKKTNGAGDQEKQQHTRSEGYSPQAKAKRAIKKSGVVFFFGILPNLENGLTYQEKARNEWK